ncbi:hypothetical protein T4B_1184 [Trichinella pseudospiralis]|uniref:Uncharacterized protein n=1 Tax=Trichinella pseudospiralis TaxID=6337 RepID=A0A0V1J803_TRIPS|nr:hypothetical protein T4B_1184 [Trichinella pseudospiralis]
MIGENEQTATKLLLDSNGIEDQCRGTYSAGCVRVAYGATLDACHGSWWTRLTGIKSSKTSSFNERLAFIVLQKSQKFCKVNALCEFKFENAYTVMIYEDGLKMKKYRYIIGLTWFGTAFYSELRFELNTG